MGLIKPPWISKEWFHDCPFNYCDHFGDKEYLAAVCIICRDEVNHKGMFEGEQIPEKRQPFVTKESDDISFDLRLTEESESEDEFFEFMEDVQEELMPPEIERFLRVLRRYGDQVEKVLIVLDQYESSELVIKARDVLFHSRHYVYVKVNRAWSSYIREIALDMREELSDSKTSALFAYVALDRNSRALLALSKSYPYDAWQETFVEILDISLDIMETIKKIFFPEDKLKYVDVGCEDYYVCFAGKRKKAKKYHRD